MNMERARRAIVPAAAAAVLCLAAAGVLAAHPQEAPAGTAGAASTHVPHGPQFAVPKTPFSIFTDSIAQV